MLQSRTQSITLYKVKGHANIDGNEQGDILAKNGIRNEYRFVAKQYEHTNTTPYSFQKDSSLGLTRRLDKDHVKCLEIEITKQ